MTAHDPARPIESAELLAHASFIRSISRSLVADRHLADDLSQEAWLQALGRPPGHAGNLRGWLVRVAQRLASGERQRGVNRRIREEDWAPAESLPSSAEAAANRETLQRVTAAVLALKEPYYSTVQMRFYEGLQPKEIAEQTGTPLATVRSRLQRALRQLREGLDAEHGGDRETWCVGLVSLVASRKYTEATASVGESVGLGAGALLMSAGAKFVVGVAAFGLATWGLMRWTSPKDLSPSVEEPARDAPAALAVFDARGEGLVEQPQALARVPGSGVPELGARPELGSLDIHVLWASSGSPAVDLEITCLIWEEPPGQRRRHGRTDATGHLLLSGLAAGRVDVDTSFGADGSCQIRPGESARFDIELPEGFTVRGRVVDSNGRGVAGAGLWLSAYANSTNGSLVAKSGADGVYQLDDVPEGRFIGAVAEGHGPAEQQRLMDFQVEGAESQDVTMELVLGDAGGGLQIQVVNRHGEPLPAALVHIIGARVSSTPSTPNRMRVGRGAAIDEWTNQLGRAEVRGLQVGTAKLDVYAPGMASRSVTAEVLEGGLQPILVEMQPECVVFGLMLTADGEPAEGARVALAARYDPLMPMTRVDRNGNYELRGLPAGEVSLKAHDSAMGSATAQLMLTLGEPMRWDPNLGAGRVITGRVEDSQGRPPTPWMVEARQRKRSRWIAQAKCDEEGRFRLLNCEPGTLTLALRRRNLQDRMPTLVREVGPHDSSEVVFIVGPDDRCGSTLSGRILSADGEPVVHANVSPWLAGSTSTLSDSTDVAGYFDLDGLRAGDYRITVRPGSGPGFVLSDVTLKADEQLDLGSIPLPRPVRLHVRVRGEDVDEFGPYWGFHLDQVDEDGNKVFPGIASIDGDAPRLTVELFPGDYMVKAAAGGLFASERLAVTLEEGVPETTLEFSPRAGRACDIGVSIPESDELPERVTIVLRDKDGIEVSRMVRDTPRNRRYRMRAQLAVGGYSFEAQSSDGRRVSHFFDVAPLSTSATESDQRLDVTTPLR